MKTAFITGIAGQDGAYLSELLLEKGYKVIGGDRRSSRSAYSRLHELGIDDKVEISDLELTDQFNVTENIRKYHPDELYNLGAQSFVGSSFNEAASTFESNTKGVLYLLEAIKQFSPKTKIYQASTSEMFGDVVETPQNEKTPFNPQSPYGISKLASHWLINNYRKCYSIFAVSGILFNHESSLRGSEFVTKKIVDYIKQQDFSSPLLLGNLDSRRDWGYAKEYVKAIWLMLQNKEPIDYVVSTGETHTIREFCEEAFKQAGIKLFFHSVGTDEEGIVDGKVVIRIDPKFYRPAEVNLLCGDSSKIRTELGWTPVVKFKDLISIMLK